MEREKTGRSPTKDIHYFEFGDNFTRFLERILDQQQGNNNEEIKELILQLMGKQDDFNAQVTAMQEDLATIGTSVATAKQEIADYIASNPALDTSALDSVVSGLDTVATSIDGIFVPTAPPPVEPPVEPPVDPNA